MTTVTRTTTITQQMRWSQTGMVSTQIVTTVTRFPEETFPEVFPRGPGNETDKRTGGQTDSRTHGQKNVLTDAQTNNNAADIIFLQKIDRQGKCIECAQSQRHAAQKPQIRNRSQTRPESNQKPQIAISHVKD
jgi:hypothetical protein